MTPLYTRWAPPPVRGREAPPSNNIIPARSLLAPLTHQLIETSTLMSSGRGWILAITAQYANGGTCNRDPSTKLWDSPKHLAWCWPPPPPPSSTLPSPLWVYVCVRQKKWGRLPLIPSMQNKKHFMILISSFIKHWTSSSRSYLSECIFISTVWREIQSSVQSLQKRLPYICTLVGRAIQSSEEL